MGLQDEINKAWDEGVREGVARTEAQMGQAIRLLSAKIVELEVQNTALQAHNTELLLRARKAEGRLRAIVARIQGEWDNLDLVEYGPLGQTTEDVLRIAQ
ncbi:hypothetical protein IVB12_15350 [Bradyrhizobium sp. 179]|uniref:hypothetical protein n=1 Tax=Bradyrhizobium sp. 179 TaxID=2782648 RepID=UPI001FF76D25|nr:hypothetical protein [Bradyrhizobium sp. 179]MCK1543291.1 hypothetical protein [Bradyrhizobium sp. 179]